jgi:hypothetical protein
VRHLLALAALLIFGAGAAEALAQQPYTPSRGSAERQAIMDAIRAHVRSEPYLGGPIVFEVRTLNVLSGWAYAFVYPRAPDGSRLVAYERAHEELCGGHVEAVLRRNAQGAWRVAVGQVAYCDPIDPEAALRLGAPEALNPSFTAMLAQRDAMQATDAVVRGESLQPASLVRLEPEALELLRNTVYARHGRPFQREDLRRYFGHHDWYRARATYSDALLTATDRANIALIQAAERRR